MKKVALLLFLTAILIGVANAYIITLSAPKTINAGEMLKVNGTSSLPAGFSTEITLSKVGSSVILDQKQITIQSNGSYSTSFDTTSLAGGQYKLEIPENNVYSYGSGSTLWLFFTVIDRRSELTITSPLTQTYNGILEVAGSISTVEDRGLKVKAQQGQTIIFGPEYISTTGSGGFDISIPIDAAGSYLVTLIDSTDYSWSIQYTVIPPTQTVTVTTEEPATTGIPETPVSTTATPLSLFLALCALAVVIIVKMRS